MLRGLRFLVFATFLVLTIARNARALNAGLAIAFTPELFAPERPCAWCAVGLLALLASYAVWLAGATLAGWRMPLWPHLLPAGALVLTVLAGPIPLRADSGGSPADRALAAMEALAARLERSADPCRADLKAEQRHLAQAAPPTGYSSFARPIPFRVVALADAVEPVRQLRQGDGAGTIYLACARGGRGFWLSAVVTDALPKSRPTLVRDGVGKVAVVTGEPAP